MTARILVADDSVTMQKVVELTFSKEDFVLIQARSGEEAIRTAKEVRPDLVLLDLVMPDKNGYEVCAALRAEPALRAVPIILLTGTFEHFDQEQGTRAGANDFVTKPFESQVLISKVKQLLFSKTVEMTAPVGPGKVPPPGVPRPAVPVVPPLPRVAPSPRPPGITPPPAPAPAPARTVVPPLTAAPPAAPPLMAQAAAPPPAPPASGGPVSDLPPPMEEISQDRLWHALDSTPPPAPTGVENFGELNLEDLATVPSSTPFELPSAEVATAPATLSLEELLSPLPMAFPRGEPGPREPEGLSGEPVFDLTGEMEAPPLPLVEVGTGEPAPLSVEDFLEPTAAAESAEMSIMQLPGMALEPGPKEGLSGEPVFDLTGEMEAPPLPLVEVGTGEPPPLSVEDFLGPTEAAVPGAVGPEPPELELPLPSIGGAEEALALAELSGLMPPLDLEESVGVPLAEQGLLVPDAPVVEGKPEVAPPAVAEAVPGGPGALGAEMVAMRQAVTERVAHELARDLSDKLLERMEQIVWEVVPDLAEILIMKEIERIRALAEGKQSS